MAFEQSTGLTAADVAAVTGNNGANGMFGDSGWWMMILFLFAFMNNGNWNNGGNGGGGYVTQSEFQAGLNNQTLQNGQSSILQAVNANQAAIQSQINSVAMAQLQSSCENRANIADLKYTVATEACADRNAISEALRDVITANNAATQRIIDQMCQDKIDAKNEEIANLRTQLNMAALNASQNAQTAQILQDNARQTVALEQYLNPTAIPAYIVANPNCCGNNWNGCGCAA